MDLIGITNEYFAEEKLNFSSHLLIPPDIITYNPHVVTASILFGYFFFVEEMFFMLFWEYLKPIRERIKERIKLWLKNII